MTHLQTAGCALLGSGTDVGKTWIGVRLFELVSQRVPGLRGIKPFESGWNAESSDARAWQNAQGDSVSVDDICRWRLPQPVTPAEEFERLECSPSNDEVLSVVRQMVHGHPFILETAGGVASPITALLDSVHLTKLLDIPSVLITNNSLGTISATTTAFSYAKVHASAPSAVIINVRQGDHDASTSSNAKWIRRQVDAPVFVVDGSFPEELVSLMVSLLRATSEASKS